MPRAVPSVNESAAGESFPLNPQPAAPTPSQRLREGIGLFNRGEFFACHEVLEAEWLEASGDQKTFLQGLIQIAVAFYHLRRGNFVGASRLLRAGGGKLAGGTSPMLSIDVRSLLEQLESLPQRIEAGALRADWPAPEIGLLGSL